MASLLEQIQEKQRQQKQASQARERILIGGEAKSGKTFTWLTIAKHLPDSRFVVFSPDDGEKRLLQFEFTELTNVTVYFCENWNAVIDTQEKLESEIASKKLTAKDWVITEGIDITYNDMRQNFIEAVVPLTEMKKHQAKTPKDLWEAILDRRARGAPILEPADWDAIHSQYEGWMRWLAFRVPCHWLATTAVAPIREEYEDKALKEFYKAVGMAIKYEGQKRAPRLFDTLIALSRTPVQYSFSIFADRGSRWKLNGNNFDARIAHANTDFYVDFLQKLAGWT